ncbi:MAG TPA: ShlB/FhaC/HecB family hemolysin secretion/activation protein [Burkholderiales bacterium]|nr:ShlB/FhaC/HecB family hemolysin secretion/activation protein [Burkholderiales bacterium]
MLLASVATGALAQLPPRPPDAGRIQEELRAPELPRKPAAPQIRIEPPAGEKKADTPPFFVSRFRVTGATVFPAADLEALLGPPNRALTLAEVQALAERITDLYKSRGYIVARALIPAQDVRDGVVEVRVVEGRYERIDINNASDLSESRLRALLGGVREEAIVHGPTLERAVLLISDLAGVQPKATLEPAEQPGYTNLVLEIVPTKSADYDVSLDNGGSTFTGRYRLSLGATANSPLKIGDRLSGRVVTTGSNLMSWRISYDAPIGSSGLRAAGYAAETTYKLGDIYTALNASGAARYIGLGAVYPLVRSAPFNLRAQVNLESREFEDRIGSLDILNEKSGQVIQWGGGGDVRDAFLGGAITGFQGIITHGRLVLNSPPLVAADAATARTYGNYYKLVVVANRLQGLTDDLRLVLSYTGQFASDNLDSSEKFSVGGITGVKAYPAGEAAGDDVHLFQAELRYNAGSVWGGQFTPSVFLDSARSKINHQTWEGVSGKNTRRLADFGLGVEWAIPGFLYVRGWYAHKLGSEPATADVDEVSRIWVQAGVLF